MGLTMSYNDNFINRLVLYIHQYPERIYPIKDNYMIHIGENDGHVEISKNKIKMIFDIEKEPIILLTDKLLIKQIRKTVGGILWQKEQEYQEDQKA